MKRLQIIILIFCVALSVPLGYFVWRTYRGLEQEETATLSFFANTLLDQMEQSLEALVRMEEARAIDEYNFYMSPPGGRPEESRSPLSHLPAQPYILGYFQNNPDGSFQTPMAQAGKSVSVDRKDAVARLEDANRVFNRKRTAVTDKISEAPALKPAEAEQKQQSSFAQKYLDLTPSQKPKVRLGQKEKRFEKITVAQAQNVARQEVGEAGKSPSPATVASSQRESAYGAAAEDSLMKSDRDLAAKKYTRRRSYPAEPEANVSLEAAAEPRDEENFQVEVAPLQSVLIDSDQMFIFRRIMINQKIYRQGFILKIHAFLKHLAQNYFIAQPMAEYAAGRNL